MTLPILSTFGWPPERAHPDILEAHQTVIDGGKAPLLALLETYKLTWFDTCQRKKTNFLFGNRDELNFLSEAAICQIRFDQEFDKLSGSKLLFPPFAAPTTPETCSLPKDTSPCNQSPAHANMALRAFGPKNTFFQWVTIQERLR